MLNVTKNAYALHCITLFLNLKDDITMSLVEHGFRNKDFALPD